MREGAIKSTHIGVAPARSSRLLTATWRRRPLCNSKALSRIGFTGDDEVEVSAVRTASDSSSRISSPRVGPTSSQTVTLSSAERASSTRAMWSAERLSRYLSSAATFCLCTRVSIRSWRGMSCRCTRPSTRRPRASRVWTSRSACCTGSRSCCSSLISALLVIGWPAAGHCVAPEVLPF